MKQFLFVLINILLISSLYATQVQEPFPFIAWSSSNHIVGKNIYSYENYASSDISQILLSTVKDSQFTSQFISKESQPEVVVIYYGSSTINAFKNPFELSESSFSLPYTYALDSVSCLENLSKLAPLIVVGESSIENSKSMDINSVKNLINSGSLVDGKVDVIVINIDSISEADINKIEKHLKEISSISFLLSEEKNVDMPLVQTRKMFLPAKIVGELPPYSNRWPAYVVEGILTTAMLIFFLLIAVLYTCCLQAPDQFETKKVQQFVM